MLLYYFLMVVDNGFVEWEVVFFVFIFFGFKLVDDIVLFDLVED